MWGKKGLAHVDQKDECTFFFRFDDDSTMHNALSRGTWYVANRPMLVHAWGSPVATAQTIPLWVKFERIPDCCWTVDGLSSLASAIGPPIYVDDLTSKLEILPFAKFCVRYKVGSELPTSIQAVVLDPITNEK